VASASHGWSARFACKSRGGREREGRGNLIVVKPAVGVSAGVTPAPTVKKKMQVSLPLSEVGAVRNDAEGLEWRPEFAESKEHLLCGQSNSTLGFPMAILLRR